MSSFPGVSGSEPQQCCEFGGDDALLSGFQDAKISGETRRVNRREFVETQRGGYLEICRLKRRLGRIENEIRRQRLCWSTEEM